jgi:hypothetical protein
MNAMPPLPAPGFLLSHLLGLVFLCHIVFMNFILAAPFLILWYNLTRRKEPYFAEWLTAALPIAFTFAINFGVASLLFTQALFTEPFYTANIILGTIWLSVVPLLILAFYGSYLAKSQIVRHPKSAGLIAGLAGLLVMGIALIMTANYFVTTTREQWPNLLNVPEKIFRHNLFAPRFLHFLIGSFAITGFWMIWISWWRERHPLDRTMVMHFRRHGQILAMCATALQIIIGVWFVLQLPPEAWEKLFGGSFISLMWMIGVAAGLVTLGFLVVSYVYSDRILWQRLSTLTLGITLIGMAAGRDAVRWTMIDKNLHPSALPCSPQYMPMVAFVLILAVGTLTLGCLYWIVRRLPPPESK